MTLTIALLGNNTVLVAALGDGLRDLGFLISDHFTDQVNAVIVDEPSGTDFIEKIRAQDETVPVIALGAQPVPQADVVVAKPLRLTALADQLETMIARNGQQVGDWRFFTKIRLLKGPNGLSEYLTPKESDLLDYLIVAGRMVTKDELLSDVFGYSAQTSTHTVETHIHTLRKKLGADLLVTDEFGYRLAW